MISKNAPLLFLRQRVGSVKSPSNLSSALFWLSGRRPYSSKGNVGSNGGSCLDEVRGHLVGSLGRLPAVPRQWHLGSSPSTSFLLRRDLENGDTIKVSRQDGGTQEDLLIEVSRNSVILRATCLVSHESETVIITEASINGARLPPGSWAPLSRYFADLSVNREFGHYVLENGGRFEQDRKSVV